MRSRFWCRSSRVIWPVSRPSRSVLLAGCWRKPLRVIRSANSPTGDYAELLIAVAYAGEVAPPNTKSWDVLAGGQKIQVKSRTAPSIGRPRGFSPFRDAADPQLLCVFVTFDEATFAVQDAHEVSRSRLALTAVPYLGSTAGRLPNGIAWDAIGATDVTTKTRNAQSRLNAMTTAQQLAPYYSDHLKTP